MAGPRLPPSSAASRVLRSRPELLTASPWQFQHVRSIIGLISWEKNSASDCPKTCAGKKPGVKRIIGQKTVSNNARIDESFTCIFASRVGNLFLVPDKLLFWLKTIPLKPLFIKKFRVLKDHQATHFCVDLRLRGIRAKLSALCLGQSHLQDSRNVQRGSASSMLNLAPTARTIGNDQSIRIFFINRWE